MLKILKEKITNKRAKLAVIGLGYVGLPVACEFANAGFDVVGIDIKAERVSKINSAISPIEGNEPGLQGLLEKVVHTGKLRASTNYESVVDADIITLNVETPIDDNHQPRYDALTLACLSLAKVIKPGVLIIVESTVSPGTTENRVRRILEQESGLSLNKDFFLGACPERVMPGKLLQNLRTLSRTCGGSTLEVANTMTRLYRCIIPEADLDPTDCLTAELVKTTENAYRDINIAFANEIALICEAVGGDVWKVRELVNKSPGRNMLIPGAGVGGHCIPKDPWLLASSAKPHFSPMLIPAARSVNENMPIHVADLTETALKTYQCKLSDATIGVLGYSYLQDSDDVRHSPSAVLVKELQLRGAKVVIHDPWVREYQGDVLECLHGCDALVLMVAHSEYRELDIKRVESLLRRQCIIDGRGLFEPDAATRAGIDLWTLGRQKKL